MRLPIQHNCQYTELNDYVASIQDVITCSGAASLVIQEDVIVNEWYRGIHNVDDQRPISPTSQFNVASVRKSYLGFAVSLALHEGKISSIDDLITRYISGLDTNLFRGTTIRHLLTHTDGVRYTERLFPAGTDWTYDNNGVNLLIQLVTQLYHCSLAELLDMKVFKPCGFSETGWRLNRTDELVWQDTTYTTTTGTEANLFVSARELAYWGYLHLVEGEINETKVAHRDVFKRSVAVQTPIALTPLQPRNGFLWFVQDKPSPVVEISETLPAGAYQILGITGCVCLVIPQYRVVAVRMYNQDAPNPSQYDYLKDIKTWGSLVLKCATAS